MTVVAKTLELPSVDFAVARYETAIRMAVIDDNGRSELRVPVLVWGGGEGPGTLVLAGQHGNEYEGVLTVQRVLNRLGSRLKGNLIVVPALNQSALRAATRTSPFDGLDLNRSFPGAADGSPSQQLAHAVSTALLPSIEVVLDLHSGGGTHYTPSVMIHYLDDEKELRRTVAASRFFDLPVRVLMDESQNSGLLDTYVEQQRKVFYCAEIGGSMLTSELIECGYRFVESFLAAFGHIENPTPPSMASPCPLFEVRDQSYYVRPNADGIFSPSVKVSQSVVRGQILGEVVNVEAPHQPPIQVTSPYDGLVYSLRANGRVRPEMAVAIIAAPARQYFLDM